ncbi:hypothetical protein D3C75_803730 [compost metagenome]
MQQLFGLGCIVIEGRHIIREIQRIWRQERLGRIGIFTRSVGRLNNFITAQRQGQGLPDFFFGQRTSITVRIEHQIGQASFGVRQDFKIIRSLNRTYILRIEVLHVNFTVLQGQISCVRILGNPVGH